MNILDLLPEIKAALAAHIAEADAATKGPWNVDSNGDIMAPWPLHCIHSVIDDVAIDSKDATFIARARTMSPFACKALLVAIEALELHSDNYETAYKNPAREALETICREWQHLLSQAKRKH